MKFKSYLIISFVVSLLVQCGQYNRIQRDLRTAEKIKITQGADFLKAHMKDGSLYLFNNWSIDKNNKSISGTGTYMDFNRQFN